MTPLNYTPSVIANIFIFIIEDVALNGGATEDDIPEEYLSQRERYENAIRKSCIYTNIVKNEVLEITGIENFG